MRIIRNTGADRVYDLLRPQLTAECQFDVLSPSFSLFTFAELVKKLDDLHRCRLVLPPADTDLALLGSNGDRAFHNQLQTHWHARQLVSLLENKTDVKRAKGAIPQGTFVIRNRDAHPQRAFLGSLAFSTDDLGLTPGNPMSLIQAFETPEEAGPHGEWFDTQWSYLGINRDAKAALITEVQALATHRDPLLVYNLILHHLFRDHENDLDEDRIIKTATGIRNTVVWQKLYVFQRDGVIGALDKLNRFGGCIIADSVGLGKTFEALAIIKYHELRNDRVLVLAPKRLRENWTIYRANDRRNILARDRFNYDVLNHTDLSRDFGLSGDLDLAHLNWGNYDLVVIDESHNFRNKRTPNANSETSYDRPHEQNRPGRRQNPRTDAFGDAGQQPPSRPSQPDCIRNREWRTGPWSITVSAASTKRRTWPKGNSTAGFN